MGGGPKNVSADSIVDLVEGISFGTYSNTSLENQIFSSTCEAKAVTDFLVYWRTIARVGNPRQLRMLVWTDLWNKGRATCRFALHMSASDPKRTSRR
jgi:hypothetical protein